MKIKSIKQNNLRILRLLHDDEIPQKWVAYKIGISQVAYCKIERGELLPSENIIQKLSDFFEIEVNEILYIPKQELKKRLMIEPTDVEEYNLLAKLEMQFDTLKRKLEIKKHNRQKDRN